MVLSLLLAGSVGCCTSPYRRWQDYIGWNCPVPDAFYPYPKPPVTTPPGPLTPAVLAPPPSVED
ncbi:MAG: hypothetical protein AB7O59_02940 [Pirellulales bacterium]